MTPQATTRLTAEQKSLIRETLAKDAPEAEFQKFITTIERNGLDPFTGQIMLTKRWDSESKGDRWTVQTNISGLRVIAERNGYEGQLGPFWCGRDGAWQDVWLDDDHPAAAKVGILKAGFREPLWGIARWKSYVQTKRDGGVTHMWSKMGDVMLAKCSEANALRRAFPLQMAGLYAEEEMLQADSEPIATACEQPVVVRPAVVPSPQQVQRAAQPMVDESKPANAPLPPHDPVTGEVLQHVAPEAPELAQLKALLKGLGHGAGTAMAFLSEMAGRTVTRMGELTLVDCQGGVKLLTTYHERLAALNYGDQDAAGRDQFLSSLLGRPMDRPMTFSEVGHVIAKIDEILQPAVTAAAAAAAPQSSDDDF